MNINENHMKINENHMKIIEKSMTETNEKTL